MTSTIPSIEWNSLIFIFDVKPDKTDLVFLSQYLTRSIPLYHVVCSLNFHPRHRDTSATRKPLCDRFSTANMKKRPKIRMWSIGSVRERGRILTSTKNLKILMSTTQRIYLGLQKTLLPRKYTPSGRYHDAGHSDFEGWSETSRTARKRIQPAIHAPQVLSTTSTTQRNNVSRITGCFDVTVLLYWRCKNPQAKHHNLVHKCSATVMMLSLEPNRAAQQWPEGVSLRETSPSVEIYSFKISKIWNFKILGF